MAGPYSVVREAGDLVFVSGQLPIDPETGATPEGIEAQTLVALRNLEAAVISAGLTKDDIVKTTVFMTDFAEFPAMNAAYAGFFGEPYPARSAMEVGALAAGAAIEIEAIARRS
ncbi:RidA family protein [Bifidobacterium simiarum]|uniref:Reactive intermediate/imine deaminase n=1 Tax=Bifidobacterium simiarum TaxID=2045441 RepID=A0A2M9HC83_9BIFI|nr:RidA family protein [Bifidobacterium simiarum]MBT1166950.1 RidA family protein [Bifidobacterium simiarum]PJM74423.1 reactive intermediate/imine deaminase [Bifidobacterium simiarum]